MEKLIKDMFTWHGTSTRKEFWLTQLMFAGIGFVVAFVASIALGAAYYDSSSHPIDGIMNLAFIYPSVTIFKRRLNDAGWSGWWMLMPIMNIVVAGFFETVKKPKKRAKKKK